MPWSDAPLAYVNKPLSDATAAAAIPRLSEVAGQVIANSAWSCSTCSMRHPLNNAISAAAIPRLSDSKPAGLASMAFACGK